MSSNVLANRVGTSLQDFSRSIMACLNGEFFASDDSCRHGSSMLSEETLNRYEIERPLHRGSFDIRTDIPVALPCITSISTYAVRLEGDDVFVTLRA